MRLAVLLVLALATPASARTVRGIVFDDANGDGKRGPDERGVKTVVAYDVRTFVDSGDDGRFTLDIPDDARGIAWARVPDGFVPGPAWTRVPERPRDGERESELAIPLRRLARRPAGAIRFVVAADTHLTAEQPFANDLGAVALAATALDPPPAFFTILGDITQSNAPEQFELVDKSLIGLSVPYVPVPGNHDWYDAGAAWFERYGPDNYSFDIGNVHFVVWNMMMLESDIVTYLGAELRRVDPAMTIVALSHAPPVPAIVERLRELGVDYVLTGHTHSNRVVDHGGLVELTTEPLLMGGLDFMPAGYRIATIDPSAPPAGAMTTEHRTVVDRPKLAVLTPSPLACASRERASAIVALPPTATLPRVTARLDCGKPIELRHVGGWNWRAELGPLGRGTHTLEIAARDTIARLLPTTTTVVFEACDAPAAPPITGSWPQLGGSSTHTGNVDRPIAPPLAPRWSTTVGGHVMTSPAIANGLVYVTVTDAADGKRGGVVALELASGAERWRVATTSPVRGSPAIHGSTLAIAELDGTLLVLDALTGAERWQRELATEMPPEAGHVFASPAIADDGAIVVGNRRKLAVLDGSGAERWTGTPVPDATYSQSLAAVAIGKDTVVGVFHRELGGVIAWERATGKERWRVEGLLATAINASPVLGSDTAYIVNGLTEVVALDLATGAERWQVKLDPQGFDWGNATLGTPALAHGILVVPTLYRDLVALDALDGHERWRFAGTPSPLRTTHYRGAREAGFESSPVVAGQTVWAIDTAGRLTAIDLRSGRLIWSHELEVPALGGLALVGDWLVAATYDGSVHALTPTTRPPTTAAAKRCDAVKQRGCCSVSSDAAAPLLSLVCALSLGSRRRRRRAIVE